ncbi:DUF1697 domain-containing protein [Colwellia sp. 1_MG-2023]|uniref:DUF1697 domain-containing protein n=1 Tax=Colwellia sp. 1_MG-2023 TaxID=3062649 RepID=UPI0026E1F3FF|nr:DUF1697 domain-containing protein [Colwellia sp. 1_MG-2023]MDO6445750.1 DUF1697 domain-containing protein [Colwellia sp. 1_MG-2023]
MQQYIALLRGINVSGQKKIKMADLVNHCQDVGYEEVSTYIQSGNICFKSASEDALELAVVLQDKIKQVYSFDVPVLVIKSEQLNNIFHELPFENIDIANEGNKVLVSFLNALPKPDEVSHLLSYVKAPEQLVIDQQVIYLHCPNGYGKTKLSNNFIESKLKVIATTRNLKTIAKLISLTV